VEDGVLYLTVLYMAHTQAHTDTAQWLVHTLTVRSAWSHMKASLTDLCCTEVNTQAFVY